jgi:hypothetical protein
MGLTEKKKADLHDKKWDDLFKKHREDWLGMASAVYDHVKKHVSGGNEPLPDDVLPNLKQMLEVNAKVRAHAEDNKSRYGHYREAFAEYIIEELYVEKAKQKITHKEAQK